MCHGTRRDGEECGWVRIVPPTLKNNSNNLSLTIWDGENQSTYVAYLHKQSSLLVRTHVTNGNRILEVKLE